MPGKDDNRNVSRIRQTVTNIVLVILVTIGMYMTMTYRSAWMDIALCYRSLKHNADGTRGGKELYNSPDTL